MSSEYKGLILGPRKRKKSLYKMLNVLTNEKSGGREIGFNHALAKTFASVYPGVFFIHPRNTYQSYTWTDSCF